MRFNPEEITSVIRTELENFESSVDVAEVGTVLEVGDGSARIYGLEKAAAGELLEFENGVRASVFNLEEGSIGVVVLGDDRGIKEGDLRDGGSLEERASKIKYWHQWPDEYDHLISKWDEFLSA